MSVVRTDAVMRAKKRRVSESRDRDGEDGSQERALVITRQLRECRFQDGAELTSIRYISSSVFKGAYQTHLSNQTVLHLSDDAISQSIDFAVMLVLKAEEKRESGKPCPGLWEQRGLTTSTPVKVHNLRD